MTNSIWIIYRKLDKKWSFAHNGEPGACVSAETANKCLRILLKDIGWHIKDDTEEYIIWKFEV